MTCHTVGKIGLMCIVLTVRNAQSRPAVQDVTEFFTGIQYGWIRGIEMEKASAMNERHNLSVTSSE
jgi:hypothetical protein